MLLITSVAGSSGGGVILFIAQIFYGFDVRESVGISIAVNGSSTIARYIITWNERNPRKPDYILQDYSFTSVLLPSIFVGN